MNTRSFSFTLGDVFITLLLIAAVVITGLKFNLAGHLKMPSENMMVSVVIESADPGYHQAINPGDKVFQKGSLSPFGTVVSVAAKPAKKTITTKDGKIVSMPFSGAEDVYVTIKAHGYKSLNGSPIIDDTFFYVNQYLPAKTSHATFASRVLDVE
jgi:hypothetical protein